MYSDSIVYRIYHQLTQSSYVDFPKTKLKFVTLNGFSPCLFHDFSVFGLGSSADLYTQVLYNYYSAPEGFCFDIVCGINPIVDDKKSPEYNVEAKVIVIKCKNKKTIFIPDFCSPYLARGLRCIHDCV